MLSFPLRFCSHASIMHDLVICFLWAETNICCTKLNYFFQKIFNFPIVCWFQKKGHLYQESCFFKTHHLWSSTTELILSLFISNCCFSTSPVRSLQMSAELSKKSNWILLKIIYLWEIYIIIYYLYMCFCRPTRKLLYRGFVNKSRHVWCDQ